MRIGILADVHGNLPALEACLRALESSRVDVYACLGDVVGYGAEPDACVARIADLGAPSVQGNHDAVAIGRDGLDRCGPLARQTLEWTRTVLSSDSRAFLAALPVGAELDGVTLAHGAPGDPWQSVATVADARDQLSAPAVVGRTLLVGHTHVPLVVSATRGALTPDRRGRIALAESEPALINPGAVGQSRQRLPRARCATLDLARGELLLHELRYDIRRCRAALRAAGLPTRACHPTAGRVRRRLSGCADLMAQRFST